MNNKKNYLDFKPDTSANFILLNPSGDTSLVDTMYFTYPDSSKVLLEGVYQKDTLKILMKTKRKEDFLLLKRGFRWVNEYPFNR